MAEIWLRTNTRALSLGILPPAILGILGLLLASGLMGRLSIVWVRIAGAVLAAASLAAICGLIRLLRQPRLAYEDQHLLVYLRRTGPIRVPIGVVECFLLGQGPSLLPGRRHRRTEAATVVVRLAESAPQWSGVDVEPALGKWCGGYITIRGTWCEPLNVGVVQRLNRRLAEVSPPSRQSQVAP
jgi:hypothetical protein